MATIVQNICLTSVKFLAHLVNQQVLHEIATLELLTLLMEEPTDSSVEVAVGVIKVCNVYTVHVQVVRYSVWVWAMPSIVRFIQNVCVCVCVCGWVGG